MSIPVNIEGKLRNSKYSDHRVIVRSDADATGGFLIYEWWTGSTGPNEHAAFDSWVEDETELEEYFAESGWQVDWGYLD
jgi:hypothetical protein